jgi:hypothetical protein
MSRLPVAARPRSLHQHTRGQQDSPSVPRPIRHFCKELQLRYISVASVTTGVAYFKVLQHSFKRVDHPDANLTAEL